jgi:hypothetical protein
MISVDGKQGTLVALNCLDDEGLAWQLSGVKRTRVRRGVAAANDSQRHFATINCRTTKGSLYHLVGAAEQRQW